MAGDAALCVGDAVWLLSGHRVWRSVDFSSEARETTLHFTMVFARRVVLVSLDLFHREPPAGRKASARRSAGRTCLFIPKQFDPHLVRFHLTFPPFLFLSPD